MDITYTKMGDYFVPNLALSESVKDFSNRKIWKAENEVFERK